MFISIYTYIQQPTHLFAQLKCIHTIFFSFMNVHHSMSQRQVMFSLPVFIVAEVVFSLYFTGEVIVGYMSYTSTMKLDNGMASTQTTFSSGGV